MSSILQGLGNRVMSQVGRGNNVTPKEEKAKEERTQGATPKNYDSYEPSTIATMMMSEEIVEEADMEEVVDTEMSDDVLVEEEELDVDGEDVDVEEDVEVEDGEVADTDSTETVTNSRVHGYQTSLSESDRAMLQIAYMGMTTSNYSNMESLFNYISSGSSSGWSATDNTSIYDSILASLSASSSSTTTTESTTEVEETEVEEAEIEAEDVETDVEAEVDTEEEILDDESVYESAEG